VKLDARKIQTNDMRAFLSELRVKFRNVNPSEKIEAIVVTAHQHGLLYEYGEKLNDPLGRDLEEIDSGEIIFRTLPFEIL